MKNFVKSFLLAAAALMLFAGCSNLSDATVSSDSAEKAVIQIGIDGFTNPSASRTINPTALDNTYNFGKITLKGESENGDSIAEEELEFTSGTASYELTYDVWYLTLTGYSNDTTPVKILEGRKRVDMKHSAPSSISFTLTADGVTTAGGVSISGTITDADSVATKYSAALYDLNTNLVIKDLSATPADVSVADADMSATHGFEFTKNNIAPGRYGFRIYFYNAAGNKIGTWGDVVVIAPGRVTTDSKTLGNILYQKPNKPKDLSAYYVNDSVSGNDYQVLITWTDDSTNEEYFELTISDVTDSSNPADYKIFGDTTDTADPHVSEVFWQSSNYVDGTLSAGSNHCILKLPLAKKFEISLKAVNFVGSSDACPRVTTNTAAFTSTDFTVPANTAYGAEKINLMRIAYDLDGGVLKTSATNTKTGTLNEYHIFKETAITLKSIEEAGSTSYPQLVNGSYPFVEWKLAGTAVTSISTFGNTTVTASYNSSTPIDYSVVDSYGSITVTATAGSTNVKNGTLPNGNPSIKIEWEDDGVTHVKVEVLQLSGSPVTAEGDINGSSKQFVFNKTNSIGAGTHQVVVYVTKSDGLVYADTFAITKNL